MGRATQAVGLGWYPIAPLALDGSIHQKHPFDPKVHDAQAPFHPKVWEPTVQSLLMGIHSIESPADEGSFSERRASSAQLRNPA